MTGSGLGGFDESTPATKMCTSRLDEARDDPPSHPQDWYELCEVGHQLACPQGRVDVGQRVTAAPRRRGRARRRRLPRGAPRGWYRRALRTPRSALRRQAAAAGAEAEVEAQGVGGAGAAARAAASMASRRGLIASSFRWCSAAAAAAAHRLRAWAPGALGAALSVAAPSQAGGAGCGRRGCGRRGGAAWRAAVAPPR